jgi:hypothetical protein
MPLLPSSIEYVQFYSELIDLVRFGYKINTDGGAGSHVKFIIDELLDKACLAHILDNERIYLNLRAE